MKVLVAEDDAVTRCILSETLRAWGYEVTACADGKEAWDAFRNGDFRLVLSDWMMPRMDGLELCRKIRTSDKSSSCYFILQTSDIDSVHSLNIVWGADSVLAKPLDSEELKARLQAAETVLARESRVESLLKTL
jgi:DNA-binding response OmpR family regulator